MDITSPEFKTGAYATYARLRAQEPVHRVDLAGRRTAWLVTRYDDVVRLLKDERLVKDRRRARGSKPFSRLAGMLGFLQALERNMLDLDPPDHARLRALVHLAFTPRLVERMRARVEELADELLARAARAGEMELIRDYALPIPLTIISEMLGIPAYDQQRFHRWSSAIVASTGQGLDSRPPTGTRRSSSVPTCSTSAVRRIATSPSGRASTIGGLEAIPVTW